MASLFGMSGCTWTLLTANSLECQLARELKTQVRRILDGLFSFVGLLALDGTMLRLIELPLEAASLGTGPDVVRQVIPDTYWWATISEV